MSIEIKVPILPESITEGSILKWYKKPGEFVKRDEHLVDIETDKVVLEVVAPVDGSVGSILKKEGDTAKSEEVVGIFEEGAADATAVALEQKIQAPTKEAKASAEPEQKQVLSPSVRKIVGEKDLDVTQMRGSGKGGRLTKEDVLKGIEAPVAKSSAPATRESTVELSFSVGERVEKRVPMTRLRARIAERLLQAQQTAAILTTFNEINMQPVMSIRQKHKEIFEKDYGVRLGFMSFFTLAVVEALKRFPIVNASVDDNDIVYHSYFDIGIAVSSPRGLVVPIIRDADTLDMAQIEKKVAYYGEKAKNGQLTLEELTGGTFTISNGGVFGSLMSTPILNPPPKRNFGDA